MTTEEVNELFEIFKKGCEQHSISTALTWVSGGKFNIIVEDNTTIAKKWALLPVSILGTKTIKDVVPEELSENFMILISFIIYYRIFKL